MNPKNRWLMPLFTFSMVGILLWVVIITLQDNQTPPESLQTDNPQPIAGSEGEEGYPLVPEPTINPNFYPGSLNEPSPTPLVCSERSEWATYTDPQGLFSFEHPTETRFMQEESDEVRIRIFPNCYDKFCGARSVEFTILDNPESLSIYNFVEQRTVLQSGEAPSLDVSAIGQYVTVSGIQGIRIDRELQQLSKPAVYIPISDGQVLEMRLVGARGAPHVNEPTCDGTVFLFDEILASVQFLNTP